MGYVSLQAHLVHSTAVGPGSSTEVITTYLIHEYDRHLNFECEMKHR